jgi:pimeloyl-ACP methyl ester carboxylesterase
VTIPPSAATTPAVDLLPGRLPPARWYPADEPGLNARQLQLAGGEVARVVEGGPPTGRPVLFLHGWGCSAYFHRHLLPAVAAAGYRVVAIDLRGHGGSDKPRDEARYTGPAMLGFLDAAIAALGLERPAVVAHSLGGAIALDFASRSAGRLSSLTLLAPVGLAPVRFVAAARLATPALTAGLLPRALRRSSIPLVLRAVYGSLGMFASRDVDQYWAPTADPAFVLALRALVHQFRFEPRSDAELAAVTTPTLVLLGGRDLLVRSPASARRATALPRATVRTIPRAGHVLAEEVPADVLADLLPHLAVNG